MPKAKEAAGMRDAASFAFICGKGDSRGEVCIAAGEYIFHHPLPRMVPLLLRKEARKGALTMQMV